MDKRAGVHSHSRSFYFQLVGRGPKKRKKSDWVSEENYQHFLRTGDRRFLYEKDYKKKGYNDFD